MFSSFNWSTGKPANRPTIFTLLIVWLGSATAQDFVRSVDGIEVERDGERLALPFFGGLDRFLPQFVDSDGDGDVDLFVSEPDGQLTFLENAGTANTHKFRLIAGAFKNLNVHSWFYLVDIDTDGDFDLYHANGDDGLAFHRNTGTGSPPSFVLETPTVVTGDNQKVSCSQLTSIPAFADIDADGDLDFFTGIITGEIALYQNIGNRGAPVFTFATGKWQDLLIFSFGQALGKSSLRDPQHGANAIEFADIDGDNDLDFFYGDLFHRGVYFLRNDGRPDNPKVAITDTLFPRQQPVETSGYNVPRFADIDGDGDKDFFVAGLQQSQHNFMLYKNFGTATAPDFRFTTADFLTVIDAGSNSAPAFADIDADADLDLFIGNLDGQISFYENTGTPTAPAFRFAMDNLPNIQPHEHFLAAPAFCDIDADGDLDLFAGSSFGRIVFYENQGSRHSPNFVLVTKAFENINAGSSSTPHFVDYDRDGDTDLFVGSSFDGAVSLFENTGTVSQPHFQLTKTIRHTFEVEDAIPFLYDWTGDGVLDLFIGERNGTILYYCGVTADSFAFVQKDFAGIDAGFYAAPAFVDINNDRQIDLFVGEGDGGINLFQGTGSSGAANLMKPPDTFALNAYPNPFRGQLHIALRTDGGKILEAPRAVIYTLMGARAAELDMRFITHGLWHGEWLPAIANLASGVYFLRVSAGNAQLTKKILFIQ